MEWLRPHTPEVLEKGRKSRHLEGTIQYAIARHFDWSKNDTFFNVSYGGGIADVLIIRASGLVVEVEIKISLADWNADQHKDKWKSKERLKISRLYYAVPSWLAEKAPAWLPETVGILAISETGICTRVREAAKVGSYKAGQADYAQLYRGVYWRYMEKRMTELRDLTRKKKGATNSAV